jgi:hypothetical protein
MHEYKQPTMLGAIAKSALSVLTWTAGGALLGGAGGLLFGTLSGALLGLIYLEAWRVVSSAGYFALCGAATGTIVGACYRLFDGPDEYDRGDWPEEDFPATSRRDVHLPSKERWMGTDASTPGRRFSEAAEAPGESRDKKPTLR